MLSHEARRHFILNFIIKWGEYSVLEMRKELFSLFGDINMRQRGGVNLFPKFQVRLEPCGVFILWSQIVR